MRRTFLLLFPAFAVLLFLCTVSRADEPAAEGGSVLKANGLVADPSLMVHEELIRGIDAASEAWRSRYENVKSIADIETYQQEHKAYFLKNLGRLWEKTPLNPQVTGAITLPEYRVEKIVIETQPHFYATGTMFLPPADKFAPPYPGLLIVCGHWKEGKAAYDHQTLAALGAMNGLVVFVFDPVDQGERFEILNEDGEMDYWGTAAHNMIGATSMLLGRNTATFEYWDNSRALDYLQSRPDVIPDKLGVAGNSGGGTQTSYLMALDERVACAAPCCFLTGFYGHLTHILNPQDAEQNIFGQVAFGMDHQDYPIMRAPKPTLMCCKTNDFFCTDDTWTSFRFANRIYSRFAAPEKLSIVEIEGGHGYSPEVYNSTIRWMVRWLTDRTELTYTIHPDTMVPIFPVEQLNSIDDPKGVMSLPGARTAFDLNRDLAEELAAERAEKLAGLTPDQFAALVRQTAVIADPDEIPAARKKDDQTGSGDLILETAPNIYCPATPVYADSQGDTLRIVVTSQGRKSEAVTELLNSLDAADGPACAIDLRGWGETQAHCKEYFRYAHFGLDGIDFYCAYLLGKNYVGMRAEDLISAAKELKEAFGNKKIELVADTASAGIVALHAAAAAPGMFEKVTLGEEIPTWTDRVNAAPAPIPMTDLIHGVLNSYDISDLEKFVL
ncbi:MAG: hypothetical protein IJG60_05650 [Thermoguttaceae bacterium]|nr:hypothetical protein [Thermoguttaceae bacterium]